MWKCEVFAVRRDALPSRSTLRRVYRYPVALGLQTAIAISAFRDACHVAASIASVIFLVNQCLGGRFAVGTNPETTGIEQAMGLRTGVHHENQ
jgi:hypothetical protein